MKNKLLGVILILLAIATGALLLLKSQDSRTEAGHTDVGGAPSPQVEPSHTATHTEPRIPAYQMASQTGNLAPTLAPARFLGKAREAYEVAREIPQTLAQLPCYCHCDQSFGHKSLHSCFVDDHASQCAVCVDEALLAYRLQREEKLTPEKVRERIIEKYSAVQ